MLFDEPNATQGFRTTGSDPLNQIASWYQFGQNLRQGAEARRARRDAEQMARNEANGNRGNNPQAAIGVDANGVYGINGSPAQPSGSIGVDASGVYGVDGIQQPSFNGGGGFDWSKASPMPSGDSVMGAWGSNGNSMFNGLGNKESDNNMNITSQKIGQNYNGRIDGQVGGLNIPRSPQGDSWGQALGNAENNSFNNFTGGSLANFQNPVSSGDSAQVAGGATNLSADNPFARSARYLNEQYDKMAYVKSALDSGVKNPLVAMAMYDQMIAPLRESAKEDELRNAFSVLQNPESSDQDKMNAIALIQYRKGDPYLAENQQMRRDKAMYEMGYLPEGDFGYGDSDGGEYGGEDANAGAIYSHLASKGVPANVIAGIMGNLQAESGFNSSAVGDNGQSIGLAQWYDSRGNNLRNFAQQRGKDWTDIPTQVDFLLSEIQQSNPDLLQRMSKLSPHDAAILFHDEFEKSADSPEMKDRRGQYAEGIYGNRRQGGNRNGRYRRDPYRVSQREQFNYNQQRDAMNYALKNRAIDARLAAKNGTVGNRVGGGIGFDKKGNLILDYDNDMRFGTAMDAFKKEFDNPTGKEGKMSANAMMGVVGSLSPIYQYLIRNGLSENDAKLAMRDLLNDRLGKDYQGKVGYQMMGDIVDRIALGGGQPQSQQPINGIGGYGTKVNEKKKDGSNHVGFLNIFGDGTDSDQFDGNSMDKSQINEIKSQRRWSIYDQAKQNGVISGMDYLGRTVDKYGNIVELDDYGYAKDGLTPEERQYRVARQHREETRGLYQD